MYLLSLLKFFVSEETSRVKKWLVGLVIALSFCGVVFGIIHMFPKHGGTIVQLLLITWCMTTIYHILTQSGGSMMTHSVNDAALERSLRRLWFTCGVLVTPYVALFIESDNVWLWALVQVMFIVWANVAGLTIGELVRVSLALDAKQAAEREPLAETFIRPPHGTTSN